MLVYSEMKCKWNEIISDKTFNKPLGSTLHSLLWDDSLSVSVIISLWCEGWCKHMRALTALCVKDINMVLHYYWETVSHTLIMSVSLYINTLRLNDFDMFKNRCDYKEHASGSVYSTVNVCLWKWLRWSNLSDGWTASEALRSHFCHQLSDSFGVWPSCGPHLLLSVGSVSPWLMMLAQGESGFFSLTPGPHDMGRMSDVLWPSSFGSFLAPRTPVTEPKVPKLVGGAQMCLLSGVFVGVLVF